MMDDHSLWSTLLSVRVDDSDPLSQQHSHNSGMIPHARANIVDPLRLIYLFGRPPANAHIILDKIFTTGGLRIFCNMASTSHCRVRRD